MYHTFINKHKKINYQAEGKCVECSNKQNQATYISLRLFDIDTSLFSNIDDNYFYVNLKFAMLLKLFNCLQNKEESSQGLLNV